MNQQTEYLKSVLNVALDKIERYWLQNDVLLKFEVKELIMPGNQGYITHQVRLYANVENPGYWRTDPRIVVLEVNNNIEEGQEHLTWANVMVEIVASGITNMHQRAIQFVRNKDRTITESFIQRPLTPQEVFKP